jgi:rod shape-determining protein MreC
MFISLHMLSTGLGPGAVASWPGRMLLEALRPFQVATTGLAESGTSLVHDYLDLVNVRKENSKLKLELAQVRTEQTRLAELEAENRRLSELLELRQALGVSAVGANVIGSDASGFSRTLLLGQGTDGGVESGMAVISAEGVVGKIIAASAHASRVLLIDDHNSALDTFDQRSRARGIVAGVLDGGLVMKYVGRTDDVKPGDTVVTSGLDGIFPRGLLVGTVKKVGRDAPGLFLDVSVAPAVNFRRLEQVLVITQTPPKLTSGKKPKS